jgi:hypothetical protein
MKKSLIPGEYDCVARQSINPKRLRLAHQTTCDAATAYFLIAVMHEKCFPGQIAPIVKLRAPRNGKLRARGWGGRKGERGYVSLPDTPYNPILHRHPFGTLRIGLVCHEYAHAVEMLRFGKSDHGPRFTMILDGLLFDTEQYWLPKSVLAAETK